MVSKEVYNIKNVIDYQIHRVARTAPLDYNELYQIGYLGYLKAQKNFNPEFGDMTLNYASIYIKQELIDTLRKEYNYRNKEMGSETPLEEVVEYEEEKNPTDDARIGKIVALMEKLPKQHRAIIKEFYLAKKPKRLKDLAAKWGVTKQRIHQIKEQGLEMIRQMLEN